MLEPRRMEYLLQRHLRSRGLLPEQDQPWCVQNSALNGRGIFATRDVSPGEVIFVDAPVLLGPRCFARYPPMCVNCHRTGCTLFPCDRGCGLPVCSDRCENDRQHVDRECRRLSSWGPNCGTMWSTDLLRAVVPVRALSLEDEDRELLMGFAHHAGFEHGREIELLRSNVDNPIDPEDEEFMVRACEVLDTNAMQTVTLAGDSTVSLRGLYPMGGVTNHSCVPNIRHYFNPSGLMVVRATVPIRKGEELTMSYADPLWDTFLRRKFLVISKHFECTCRRCSDPTELGTNAGAMWCADVECFGLIFPDDPVSAVAPWTCRECGRKVSSRQMKVIWSGIQSIINETLFQPPRKILRFVERELRTLVPETNHIMLDMKYRMVSYFGRSEGLTFKDLTDAELQLKSKYCVDLLELMEKLELGDCQKKGFVLYELYCTKNEQSLRKESGENNKEDTARILDSALRILQDDVAAPDDLKTLKIPHS